MRALSTRARITATSFVNEYGWGNFRGSPDRLMGRYHDAHLYLAHWGIRRVMFRLPTRLLSLDVLEPYCVGGQVAAWTIGVPTGGGAVQDGRPLSASVDLTHHDKKRLILTQGPEITVRPVSTRLLTRGDA